MEEYMLPCVSKTIFGIDCLGCGIQRAVFLLFQGEFKASFLLYPALFPLFIFLGTIVVSIIHSSKNYTSWIKIFGLLTLSTMVVSYIFKHFTS